MKKSIIFLTILILTLILGGCKNKSDSASEGTMDKDASYALGMSIGDLINSRFVSDGIIPNRKQFLKGIEDTLSGRKLRFTQEEADQKIQAAINDIIKQRYGEFMQESDNDYLQEGIDFLVENSKKTGIITTSSGLQYEVIKEGNGKKPSASDMVRVHYEGKLIDGTIFDSSYGRDPIEFPLDAVITGWTEGLQLMRIGSKYRLFIPSQLAYGEEGRRYIPPNSVLIFEVELLDIL